MSLMNKIIFKLIFLLICSCNIESNKEISKIGEKLYNRSSEVNNLINLLDELPDSSNIFLISISNTTDRVEIEYYYDYLKKEGYSTNSNYKYLDYSKNKKLKISEIAKSLKFTGIKIFKNEFILFEIYGRNRRKKYFYYTYIKDHDIFKKEYNENIYSYHKYNDVINNIELLNDKPYVLMFDSSFAMISL